MPVHHQQCFNGVFWNTFKALVFVIRKVNDKPILRSDRIRKLLGTVQS
jgi:hypothetical protein